jgi:hypothetical protein
MHPRFRFGLEAPVIERIADRVDVSDRDMQPNPAVALPGFNDENKVFGIGGQTVGEQTTGRAGADDDVIKSFRR